MPGNTRTYRSPGRAARAEQTRSRVLEAARGAFTRSGYATSMAEVARGAGVARATVELLFGTKAALLDAVVDVALAGDDVAVPILDRPGVRALDALAPAEFLDAAATAFAGGAARVAPVLRALDEGAVRSPDLAALADRLVRQRTVMAGWVVDHVVGADELAADLDREEALSTVVALLDPVLHRSLLGRGWSAARLAAWLGRSLRRLLLDPPG